MPKCGERMSKCQRTWLPFANPADAERIKEGFENAGLSH
jgi:hypothetical protein